MADLTQLPTGNPSLPATSAFNRRILDVLVGFGVIAQVMLVVMLMLGREGASAAPIAGAATVVLVMLAYFYARWLWPILARRHILALLLLKELGIFLLLGFVVGLVSLVRWLS